MEVALLTIGIKQSKQPERPLWQAHMLRHGTTEQEIHAAAVIASTAAAPSASRVPAPVILTKRVMSVGWAFFLISLGAPHVRPPHGGVPHRTCGEPNEIELTAINP